MSFGELSFAGTHICKAGKTHDEMHKILLPKNATYKDGPQIRQNRHAKQDAPKNQHQDPPISYLEEDRPEGAPFGLGRPNGSSDPLLGLNGPSFLLRSPTAPLTADPPMERLYKEDERPLSRHTISL